MVSRTAAPARSGRWPLSPRWTALLVLLALVFVGLRVLHATAPPPVGSTTAASRLVLVGVTGRSRLSEHDRAVLGSRLDSAQVGAVSVRTRYLGECGAAGWVTLGAGRPTSTGGRCDPRTDGGRVVDWPGYESAAAADRGDARLGTLAGAAAGCVAAVGPGAALAAARPDGSLASYQNASSFLAGGATLSCPVTLVDAGADSAAVLDALVPRREVTVLVAGVGPAPGSMDPGLQVVYRLGAAPAGWLTSASTRRTGVVTLADLTRTLVGFGRAEVGALPIDGAVLQVEPDSLTIGGVDEHLRGVAALSDAVPDAYRGLGIVGGLVVGLLVLGLALRRPGLPRLALAFGTVLPAGMLLVGAVPWQRAGSPALVVTLLVAALAMALAVAATLLARAARVPTAVAGAALVVTAFTAEAALGGVLQPGSLLNSRPIFGLRWYGFGNSTFAAYATAGLVLAGYLGHRLRRSGHPRSAVVAAAAVGSGIVLCEGWPSMGSDFGGVIALTPGVCWLVLTLSGARVTVPRLLAIGVAAVAAITLISWLDWRRGPGRRSHLGGFVQRVLDGDAADVVARKAVASAETFTGLGILALVLGAACWVLFFRRLLPVLKRGFDTLGGVAVAVLATAVLGTLLNDAGVAVWVAVTSIFALLVASLWCEHALPRRQRQAPVGSHR